MYMLTTIFETSLVNEILFSFLLFKRQFMFSKEGKCVKMSQINL